MIDILSPGANACLLPAALRFAAACGALAVTRFGAQTSLPTRAEVEPVLGPQLSGS